MQGCPATAGTYAPFTWRIFSFDKDKWGRLQGGQYPLFVFFLLDEGHFGNTSIQVNAVFIDLDHLVVEVAHQATRDRDRGQDVLFLFTVDDLL